VATSGLPVLAWIGLGIGAVLVVLVVVAIFAYPRDNSF
jgi:hypothetical protein